MNLGLHQSDVSVVWDLGPHDFSILRYWLDETPTHASALSRSCVIPDIPDVAFINLEFPSGTIAHVELSWLAPSKLRRTTIVGSEKMVVYDDTRTEPVRVFDSGVTLRDPETFGEYQLTYRTGDIVSPHIEVAEPLALELEDFVRAINTGSTPTLFARARPRGRPNDRGGGRVAGAERRQGRSRRRSEPGVIEAAREGRHAPPLRAAHPFGLTPLEVASGLVFGFTPPEPMPAELEAGSPVEALEQAILPALMRPPCLISFGGRDSSMILAVAVRLARREGLELPVPATNRFPRMESRHESAWQERVIVHLGLTQWLRLEFTDELDAVGPIAMRALRKHGLLVPFDAHFHLPLFDEAFGGSLVTGVGGDEALGIHRWSRAEHVLGKVAPVRTTSVSRRGGSLDLPWLQPATQEEARARWVATIASQPLRWQLRFAWYRRLRSIRLSIDSLDRLASDHRVETHHPFVDAGFAASVTGLPRERFVGRATAMRELFGDLLPLDLMAKRSNCHHDFAFWNEHSRRLVDSWDGEGVDPDLVDRESLRKEWSQANPDPRTLSLLQCVALAREAPSAVPSPASAYGVV